MLPVHVSLPKETVRNFLCDKLKLDKTTLEEIDNFKSPSSSCLKLLNKIILAFHINIPFQNIVLLSEPKEKRKMPSLNFIFEEVISGRGGMCYVNNTFFKYLLEVIGFNVTLLSGTVNAPNSHTITLVKDVLYKGDIYLADVGVGFPVLEAISLDFNLESPVYNHSYITCKYVKRIDDGVNKNEEPVIFERLHKKQSDGEVNWVKFYDFTLEPRDIAFFESEKSWTRYVYTEAEHFHGFLLLNAFIGCKAITVLNLNVKIESLEDKKEMQLGIKSDIISVENVIINHFPQLQPYIDKAMKNLKLC